MASGRSRVLVLACLALFAWTGEASAYPTYHPFQANVGVLPPNQASLACTTCHVSLGGGGDCGFAPCFNPFGLSYRLTSSGWNGISTFNADSDNRSNSQEVQTDFTSPGFPNGAESVGCDMATCAISGSYACGGNVVCTSTRSTYDTNRSYYTFGFACAAHTSGTLLLGDGSWVGDCADTNECAGNPCGAGSCAQRPLGSWTSPGYDCSCPPGYLTDGTTCVVSDECTTNMDDCDPAADCTDPSSAIGDYACACPFPAYVGDGHVSGTGCTNVNECLDSSLFTCTENSSCVDAIGSYTCVCDAGFTAMAGACVDIDECQVATVCPSGEMCSNTSGAFACLCPLGTSRPVPGDACIVVCGDGARDPSEACDDGDTEAGDGCSPTCTVEPGFGCTGPAPGPASVCATTCGDRLIDPPETCDDGMDNSDTAPNACRTSCALAYCGDGVVDDGEVCDRGGVLPANADPDACTTEGCAMPTTDGGIDFGGGGGGCVAARSGRADASVFIALLFFAGLALRRRR